MAVPFIQIVGCLKFAFRPGNDELKMGSNPQVGSSDSEASRFPADVRCGGLCLSSEVAFQSAEAGCFQCTLFTTPADLEVGLEIWCYCRTHLISFS